MSITSKTHSDRSYFTVRLTSQIQSADIKVVSSENPVLTPGAIDIQIPRDRVVSMQIVGEYNLSLPSIVLEVDIPNKDIFNVIAENKGIFITVQIFSPGSSTSKRMMFITTKQTMVQYDRSKYGMKLYGSIFILSKLLDSHIRCIGPNIGSYKNTGSEMDGCSSCQALEYILMDSTNGIKAGVGDNEYSCVRNGSESWPSSNDNMIWIQHNSTNIDMINQIIRYSWMSAMDSTDGKIDFLIFTFKLFTEMSGGKEFIKVVAKKFSELNNIPGKAITTSGWSKLSFTNGTEIGDYSYRPGTVVSEFKYNDKSRIPQDTYLDKLMNFLGITKSKDKARESFRISEYRHNNGNVHNKFSIASYNNATGHHNFGTMTMILEFDMFVTTYDLLDPLSMKVSDSHNVPDILNHKNYTVTGVSFIYDSKSGSKTMIKCNKLGV